MLRLILDSHPDIAVGAETGFMGAMLAAKAIPNWKHGNDWYRLIGWTDEDFDARLRDFYGGMFERYARAQGKRRWGEKTPFHTQHMGAMAELFPDSVFVGIVRHPGAVAFSLRKNFHYTLSDALAYWSATNLDMVRSATELGERFTLVRYEDLVSEREPVLRGLMSFLAEPWSPDLLEHHRVQREKGAPRVADGSTVTRDPIDAKRAVQWTSAATPADYEALAETAELAAFFGYDAADPTSLDPLLPANDGAGRLPTGTDLALRRGAWADRLDFDLRPPAPVIDASAEELAERLARVEQALARARSRRSVRFSEALRRVQRGRSPQAVREAWAMLRGPHT